MASASDIFLERGRSRLHRALSKEGLDLPVVEARVKTGVAAERKRARRPGARVNDLIGFRVIVDHCGLIAAAEEAVRVWADDLGLTLLGQDDYFSHPGIGGYRALHFDYELSESDAAGLPRDAGIEVQITTGLLAAVARVSRELVYGEDRDARSKTAVQLEAMTLDVVRLDRQLGVISAGAASVPGEGGGDRR